MRFSKITFYINTTLLVIIVLFGVNTFSVRGHELIQRVLADVNEITGVGTVNYIARFVGAANPSNSIGDSIIYDDGVGHVGIGITTPGESLHIDKSTATTGPNIKIDSSLSNGSDYMGGLLYAMDNVNAGAVRLKEHTADNYGLEFQTFNGTALGTKMTILGNGRVGIGTTAPGNKLDIAGGDINMDDGTAIYSRGVMSIFGEGVLYLRNKGGVVINKNWGSNGNLTVENAMTLTPLSADPTGLTNGMMWMRQ